MMLGGCRLGGRCRSLVRSIRMVLDMAVGRENKTDDSEYLQVKSPRGHSQRAKAWVVHVCCGFCVNSLLN